MIAVSSTHPPQNTVLIFHRPSLLGVLSSEGISNDEYIAGSPSFNIFPNSLSFYDVIDRPVLHLIKSRGSIFFAKITWDVYDSS